MPAKPPAKPREVTMTTTESPTPLKPVCADCGGELGHDGMVLKDGSRVCVACLRKIRAAMLANPILFIDPHTPKPTGLWYR